jgi:hypothetical protein
MVTLVYTDSGEMYSAVPASEWLSIGKGVRARLKIASGSLRADRKTLINTSFQIVMQQNMRLQRDLTSPPASGTTYMVYLWHEM